MLIYFHKAWQYDAVCFFGFNLIGMPKSAMVATIFKFRRDLCEQVFVEQVPSI